MDASLTLIVLIGFIILAAVIIGLVVWVTSLSGKVRRQADVLVDLQARANAPAQVKRAASTQPFDTASIENVEKTLAQARAVQDEQIRAAQAGRTCSKERPLQEASSQGSNASPAKCAQSAHVQAASVPSVESDGDASKPVLTAWAAQPSQAGSAHPAQVAQTSQQAQPARAASATALEPQQAHPSQTSQGRASRAEGAGGASAELPAHQAHAFHTETAHPSQAASAEPPYASYSPVRAAQARNAHIALDDSEDYESDFFKGYHQEKPEKTFGGRKNTPSIPFGKDKSRIRKKESYVRNAVDNDFDPDSIDFSRVAGYKDRINK